MENSPQQAARANQNRGQAALTKYPDPRLYVLARLYNRSPIPEIGLHFAAIAARVQEIAHCLDVTDEVIAGTWAPAPPPEGATLEGCGADRVG